MANPDPSPATRFQPGNRANPGGRPKGRSLTKLLRELLECPADGGDGRTNAEALAERPVRAALAGDLRALGIISERTEGKAPDRPPSEDAGARAVITMPDNGRDGPRIVAPDDDGRYPWKTDRRRIAGPSSRLDRPSTRPRVGPRRLEEWDGGYAE